MGKVPEDWWDDIAAGGSMPPGDRLGYPTQKPLRLMERIIKACSDEGDLVADPVLRFRNHPRCGQTGRSPLVGV